MDEAALEEEKLEIIRRYRQLLRVSLKTREEGDGRLIRKAFDMSLEAHRDMRRKSGEPYIYHPIAVARIAAEEIGLGTTSIVCALLHDVVEDTEITLETIEKEFGSKVAYIIDGLTKISGIHGQSNSPQAENFRHMLLTLSDDVRVILIKLCDRLHNMRTLEHMSAKGRLKIASETMYLYAPLAHRLGLYAVKTELEDLSLKYTEPDMYEFIRRKLRESKEQRTKYIRGFIRPLRNELARVNVSYEIKGRPKSIFSILQKMRKQGVEFEQVYDLFAIRIIVDSDRKHEKIDCWNVYSIVTSIYRPNPDRLRDWISNPKGNGYESLHTTVMGPKGKWVEVQIRSRRMDEIAEKGYAAHWRYKEGNQSDNGLDNWLSRVREILENPQDNAIDFLDDFKLNLFSEEIFVFTPKGDVKKLPTNSTALDFAFEIHTEVGSQCIGAKVNNKLVPLSHTLKNGDQVEIITSARQKPNKGWLEYVVTGKAKTKINQVLKEEKRKKAEDGKEILARKFRNQKIQMTTENLRILCLYFGVQSEADLFVLAADGKLPKGEKSFKSVIHDHKEKVTRRGDRPAPVENKKAGELIIGDHIDGSLKYSFAKCCSPIPGDDVVGFITVGEGVKIHRTNCKNAIRLMSNYGYRIINARWAGQKMADHSFSAGLEITGIDSVGLVSRITDIISKELKINMNSISFTANEGTFIGNLVLDVDSRGHLDSLIEEIKNIDPYLQVARTDLNEV
ncbi:MAG: bifunctional (p)ppGpp synthetase/guanosine-3',5'-bis(diphosphate) 3'-pyrophosphohydrolase [Flavobacteriales bacterium]|nr:bifunctional (p)ppGpp synthetase/guanosine-3',5'-bis(diphosphate) 3'-pyrophosphohydrolase [Bacteroidota bacterium]MCB9241744.1 bifunctional (p)ppGpp synthetase/guanosine-3',5'-bis(diphosphate) 3'-pyrophosphohydrolase [Flavobacteriales bacterium]